MNWIAKALIQHIFSYIPFGEKLNYVGQRYFIRNLPHSEKQFSSRVGQALKHFKNFQEYGLSTESPTFYEFGSGWDFIIPLTYWLMGIDCQILTDIRPLIRVELINHTLNSLFVHQHEMPFLSRKMSTQFRLKSGSTDELRGLFGIIYMAPCDAKHVSTIKTNSVDFISSTGVLEHVPSQDIVPILQECERILKPSGIMSHSIDYQDHYAITDQTIYVYNFLKYSDVTWRLVNPPLHYQNRLRHKDYIAMIKDSTSLKIMDEIIERPTPERVNSLQQLTLAPKFRDGYSYDELSITSATLVLKKELI